MSPVIPEDFPDELTELPPHRCRSTGCVGNTGSGGVWAGPPYRHRIVLINALTMKDSQDRQYFRTNPSVNSRRRLRTAADYAALNKALNEWAAVPM